AETGAIDRGGAEQVAVLERLLGCRQGKAAVEAAIRPSVGVWQELAQIEIEDLTGKRGGKRTCIKVANRTDRATALACSLEERLDGVTQGGHRAHARNHDPATIHNPLRSERLIPSGESPWQPPGRARS